MAGDFVGLRGQDLLFQELGSVQNKYQDPVTGSPGVPGNGDETISELE